MLTKAVLWVVCLVQVFARPENMCSVLEDEDTNIHGYIDENDGKNKDVKYYKPEEETAEFWKKQAQVSLNEKLDIYPITGVAKNVIIFLGDGMSIPTITAARAYLGQSNNKTGEETQLSFEKFPFAGFSKTYCVNKQVADSACSATAYLGGVKANEGTIGVTASVKLGDCKSMKNPNNHVSSIGRWSQLQGKRTGIVTTTRVTHASPAGVYAHTAHRKWETDSDVTNSGFNPKDCPDIANQLVHGETGRNLNVILGGGRGEFISKSVKDEDGKKGHRGDQRNLINEWKEQKSGSTYKYVTNSNDLLKLPRDTKYVLGLFAKSHMKYNVDRNPSEKPSLAEMTETAIKLLSQGEKGYFLFVEGGRIDHAHHSTKTRKALNETVEFHKAVQVAVDMTNIKDTLIVVTSDHAHSMSINGYAHRGNDILGIAGKGSDGLPYTILSYANGPGYRKEEKGKRHDVSEDDLSDNEYRYPAMVPKIRETHGGDDVGIFARGPWAHLLTGVNEQNLIPHVMAYASCVGDGVTVCDDAKKRFR